MQSPPSLDVPQRLLVLSEMGAWSASTRYRVLQHLPRLRSFFQRLDVSLAEDTVERAPGRIGQVRYFGTHALRYVDRGRTVREQLREADATFIQRGLYPMGPGSIARPIASFTGRVVFDLDDAVFSLKPSMAGRGPATRWLYGPQQASTLIHRADAIVVSSSELANLLPSGVVAPVVLPTVPDPSRYQMANHSDGPVVVGWAGTVGNIRYLEPLRPVFERLIAEDVLRFEVVSSHPWSGPSTFRPWRLDEEATIFQRFSIGIMPLPDTEYTRAKAGFKLLQYMAAGLPVVASSVGVNQELIARSGGGLVADSPTQWEEALRTLACDSDLRRRLGGLGRAYVERYSDLDDQAETIARLLLS